MQIAARQIWNYSSHSGNWTLRTSVVAVGADRSEAQLTAAALFGRGEGTGTLCSDSRRLATRSLLLVAKGDMSMKRRPRTFGTPLVPTDKLYLYATNKQIETAHMHRAFYSLFVAPAVPFTTDLHSSVFFAFRLLFFFLSPNFRSCESSSASSCRLSVRLHFSLYTSGLAFHQEAC
jgi:hypothetical protein